MEVLSVLGSLFSNAVTGGLTGIIGGISSAIVNYKMQKIKYKHEEEIIKLRMEASKTDAEMKQAIVKTETEGAVEVAETEAWKESYKELDKKYFDKTYFSYLPAWSRPVVGFLFASLDFIRGIVRPVLTFYIITLVSWIVLNTYKASPNAFVSSANAIVDNILFLMNVIISWYFCNRQILKHWSMIDAKG